MSNECRINARVPGPLADAIAERAEAAGLSVSDVYRAAVIRELERPLDRKARSFVAAWLDGFADADTATATADALDAQKDS